MITLIFTSHCFLCICSHIQILHGTVTIWLCFISLSAVLHHQEAQNMGASPPCMSQLDYLTYLSFSQMFYPNAHIVIQLTLWESGQYSFGYMKFCLFISSESEHSLELFSRVYRALVTWFFNSKVRSSGLALPCEFTFETKTHSVPNTCDDR